MSTRSWLAAAALSLALVAGLGLVAGCAKHNPTTGTTSSGSTESTTSTTATTSAGGASGTNGGSGATTLTTGRTSYTFREVWRRAIVRAHQWDPGSFLVQAFAYNPNNQGATSSWTMYFQRQTDRAYEVIQLDASGNVTVTKVYASGAKPAWHSIPTQVIDSDRVVTRALQRFSDLKATSLSNRQLMLDWAPDRPVVRWSYTVYDADSHKFLGEVMDATTGNRIERKTYPVYATQ